MRLAAVVEAADDLARDGFYAEALELIYDLEDTAWSKQAEKNLEAELGGAEALAGNRGRETCRRLRAPGPHPAAPR